MQIEQGKFYRTRDGRKVGPMQVGCRYFCWEQDHASARDLEWHPKTGKHIDGFGMTEADDLVAEWSDTPPLLGDMTDAEIGALVRAQIGGKTIQRWDSVWEDDDYPDWYFEKAYRIKPEPVRKTVTLFREPRPAVLPLDPVGTIDLIDGVAQPDTFRLLAGRV